MTTGFSPSEYREGVEKALNNELHQHCIKYQGSSPRELSITIELTDRAYMLMGMCAMAYEAEERWGDEL